MVSSAHVAAIPSNILAYAFRKSSRVVGRGSCGAEAVDEDLSSDNGRGKHCPALRLVTPVCIIYLIPHRILWGRHYNCSFGTHEGIGVSKDINMLQLAGIEQKLGLPSPEPALTHGILGKKFLLVLSARQAD